MGLHIFICEPVLKIDCKSMLPAIAVPGKKDGQTTHSQFQRKQRMSGIIEDIPMEKRRTLGNPLDSMILNCEFNGYACNMT